MSPRSLNLFKKGTENKSRVEPGFVDVNTVEGKMKVDTRVSEVQNRYASRVISILGGMFMAAAAYTWWVLHSQSAPDWIMNEVASNVIHYTGGKSLSDQVVSLQYRNKELQNNNDELQKQTSGVGLMAAALTSAESIAKQKDDTIKNQASIIAMNEVTIKNLQTTLSESKRKLAAQTTITQKQFDIISADTEEIGRLRLEVKRLAQLAGSAEAADNTATSHAWTSQETSPASEKTQTVGKTDVVKPEQSKNQLSSVSKIGMPIALTPSELKENTASWGHPRTTTKIDLTMTWGVPSVAVHSNASPIQDASPIQKEETTTPVPSEQRSSEPEEIRPSDMLQAGKTTENRTPSVSPTQFNHTLKEGIVSSNQNEIVKPTGRPISYKELQSIVKSANASLGTPGMEIHTSRVSKDKFRVWMTYEGFSSASFFTNTPKHRDRLTRAGMKKWALETKAYLWLVPLIKKVASDHQMSLNKQDATSMEWVKHLVVIESSLRGKVRFLLDPQGAKIDVTVRKKDITESYLESIFKNMRAKLNPKSQASLT